MDLLKNNKLATPPNELEDTMALRRAASNVTQNASTDVGADLKPFDSNYFQSFLKIYENFLATNRLKGCKTLVNYQSSFPYSFKRIGQRLYNHPDMTYIHKLDGILYNIKYIVLSRDITDCVTSSLKRGFSGDYTHGLQTVEYLLHYMSNSMKVVPCDRIFYLNFEHILADYDSYISPLSSFLELDQEQEEKLISNINILKKQKKTKSELTGFSIYKECAGMSLKECSEVLQVDTNSYFSERKFMWPLFAGNGNKWNRL